MLFRSGRGLGPGIARDQAPVRAFKLFGYSRTTDAMENRFDSVLIDLLLDGRLEDDGGLLVLAEASDG